MNFDLRSTATWPLRTLGLDPGRALENAHPSEAELQRQRAELREQVQRRFPPREARHDRA